MTKNSEIEKALNTIKWVSRLPILFAMLGVGVFLYESSYGVAGYLFNICATLFVVSLIVYFRLRCPQCRERFASSPALNWAKPIRCRSCGLSSTQKPTDQSDI